MDLYPAGLKAAADQSANQYQLVKLSAANTAAVCSSAGDQPLGVLQNKPAAAGRAAKVCCFGECEIKAGGSFSVGALLGTDASGKAVAKTADGDWWIAIALEAATAADQVVRCLVVGPRQRAS